MNEYAILAFVVTPAIVVAIGWAAVVLNERSPRRQFGVVATRDGGRPASPTEP